MKLSIVIPVFNESSTIREIIACVEKSPFPAAWGKEIVIVDDCSTDGTRDILKEYEARHTVMYRAANGGKGSAVRDGIVQATGDHLLIQDADLEYDPADIPSMIAAITSDKDVIRGSRELSKGTRRGGFLARIGVLGITKLFNLLYGTRLTDIWTCYILFPRTAGQYFAAGRFESELLFAAACVRNGYYTKEVAISYYPRTTAEGKKIRYRDGFYAVYAIVRDWLVHLPRVLLLPLAAYFLAMAIAFPITGIFNDRVDTAVYVAQIEGYQALLTGGGFSPALATFKPLPGMVGALLSFIVHPYVALFVMNIALFFGFIFAFYGMLRQLSFERLHAAVGASWVALAYPMFKYGLGLGTDLWGLFAATMVVLFVLCAVRTERRSLIVLASIIGFLGSLAKETAVLGLLFAGLYLLSFVFSWGIRRTLQWLIPLCAPFFVLQGLFLALVVWFGGPTFLDWYNVNTAGYTETYYRLNLFIGVMLSAFSVLLMYAGVGLVRAWRSRDILKAEWHRTFALLFLAMAPVIMWPIFISRVLFIFALAIIPLALYGVVPVVRRLPKLAFLIFALPPLASIGLFLVSRNEALYTVLQRML